MSTKSHKTFIIQTIDFSPSMLLLCSHKQSLNIQYPEKQIQSYHVALKKLSRVKARDNTPDINRGFSFIIVRLIDLDQLQRRSIGKPDVINARFQRRSIDQLPLLYQPYMFQHPSLVIDQRGGRIDKLRIAQF
jgi:hypothetical protein